MPSRVESNRRRFRSARSQEFPADPSACDWHNQFLRACGPRRLVVAILGPCMRWRRRLTRRFLDPRSRRCPTRPPAACSAQRPRGWYSVFHAQVGGKEAESVLDYLQSIKKIELKPNPFLKKP